MLAEGVGPFTIQIENEVIIDRQALLLLCLYLRPVTIPAIPPCFLPYFGNHRIPIEAAPDLVRPRANP